MTVRLGSILAVAEAQPHDEAMEWIRRMASGRPFGEDRQGDARRLLSLDPCWDRSGGRATLGESLYAAHRAVARLIVSGWSK